MVVRVALITSSMSFALVLETMFRRLTCGTREWKRWMTVSKEWLVCDVNRWIVTGSVVVFGGNMEGCGGDLMLE